MSNSSGQADVVYRLALPLIAVVIASGAAPVAPPLSIASVTAPDSVTAGAAASGYVSLNTPAPAGGVVVNLWTSGTPAFVPASVTIAPGTTRAGFKITTVQTSEVAQPVITAFYKGARKTATLTVKPGVALSSVSATPDKVLARGSATGTVTLTAEAPAGGLVIQLWTNGSPTFVPKKVTVPAGAAKATFPVTTTATTTAAQSTITAFYKGASKTASFTVAAAPGLASITAPASVIGGDSLSGSVSFSAPAPAKGVVVNLWTSGAPAFVPSSVTIPAGSTSAAFKIRTEQTSAPAHPVITAFHSGISKTVTLTVTPIPGLSNVSVAPDKVKAGASATGTVTLSTAAPAGGLVIDLWTNGSPAFVPAHVTVPAGAATATFPVTIATTATAAQDVVTAFYKGIRKTASITVAPSGVVARAQRH